MAPGPAARRLRGDRRPQRGRGGPGAAARGPGRPGERPEDPEEFYDHQLVGLAVATTDGRAVGTVAEVLHSGAQDLLVVRREGREDALVPFVSALVPEVDLASGRVLVADRPGLLEPLVEPLLGQPDGTDG